MTVDSFIVDQFSLKDRVAVVTGGTGVLGGAMARGLARAGAFVGVLGRRAAVADAVVQDIREAGGDGITLAADVLNPEQLAAACDRLISHRGRVDILVNGAGGNVPAATVAPHQTIFDLAPTALRDVLDLNLIGTILASQVFAKSMGAAGKGCIINISSMASTRALTRVIGYGAAKAAVENVTRWLAVELARVYGDGLRVNAIAPGFFVGEQNRALLLQPDGSLTDRGRTIIQHTPAGRFGQPEELVGTLIWLCSPAAAFVNGVVVPVDGGFSAFSGV